MRGEAVNDAKAEAYKVAALGVMNALNELYARKDLNDEARAVLDEVLAIHNALARAAKARRESP